MLIGRLIGWLERRFYRSADAPWQQLMNGALLALLMTGGALGLGWLLQRALDAIPFGWLLVGVLMSTLIAQRSLVQHVSDVAKALDQGLETGRAAVAHIVGRDPASLDQASVARAAVESLAENFADGVVVPVFWAALLGLPGILAYKTINTLDSMIGYRSPHYLYFGRASARLDDLVNFVPARLAAALIALAAMRPQRIRRALETMGRDASHHRSPNAGWPEAAMAGALGVKLAGPRRYRDDVVDDPYIGIGSPELDTHHIREAVAIAWRAWWLLLAAVALLVLV